MSKSRKTFVFSFFFFIFLLSPLFSEPQGFHLKGGEALPPAYDDQGAFCISSGKHAIIHWDHFSIAPHEVVHFIQHHPKGAVLNRVMGKGGSDIHGLLKSNGKVFLINPNGILIGPTGRIETAGFIASALDVLDEDFLRGGELLFGNAGPGKVVNLGIIESRAGDILLLARQVKNRGQLVAEKGFVGMAGATDVLIRPEGSEERISIRAGTLVPDSEEDYLIDHTSEGMIRALSVELKSGHHPYGKAIRSSGRIDALASKKEKGRLYLVAKSGETQVDGMLTSAGGDIHALGEDVKLTKRAHIDASSQEGGGDILVGGDYRGENPSIPNANRVFIAPEAVICSDGLGEGSGGKVITWGTDANQFYGTIFARGGERKGDGGFVEISSLGDWRYRGHVDTRAPHGKTGILLFDPSDITVVAGGGPSAPVFPTTAGPPTDTYDPAVNNATLAAGEVQSALGSNNVIIATASGTGGVGFGDVRFNGPFTITWATDKFLRVLADRSLRVDGDVTISSTYSGAALPDPIIDFQANTAGASTGNFQGMDIRGTISADDGDIYMEGRGGTTANDRGVIVRSSVSTSGNGGIEIRGFSPAGSGGNNREGIRLRSGADLSVVNGNLLLHGEGGGTGNGSQGIQLNGNATVTSSGSGTITLEGTGAPNGNNQTAGVRLDGTSSITSTATGAISITGTGGANANNQVSGVRVEDNSLITSTGMGLITITGDGGANANQQASGFTMQNNATVSSTGGGDITITATGHGTGDNSAGFRRRPTGGTPTLSSTSGNIMITATGGGTAGATGCDGISLRDDIIIETTAGGNITVISATGGSGASDNNGIILGNGAIIRTTSLTAGTIDLTANGAPTGAQNRGLYVMGTGEISTTTGTIRVNATGDGAAGATDCQGVYVTDAGDISMSGAGTIDVRGIGHNGGVSNEGVLLDSAGNRIFGAGTAGSSITVNGIGDGTGSNIPGVSVTGGARIVDAPTISVTGIGSSLGTDTSYGVVVSGGGSQISGSSSITVTGTAFGTTTDNAGIAVLSSGVIDTGVGGGNVTLTGIGSTVGSTGNHGVLIDGLGSLVRSQTAGVLSIDGTGGGNNSNNVGILIRNSGVAATGTATIMMTGNGSSTGSSGCKGIVVNTAGAVTGASTVSLTGTGRGSTTDNVGIEIVTSGDVDAVGGATLMGTGSIAGTTGNHGILVDGPGSQVRNQTSGILMLTGTGNGFGDTNAGIQVQNSGVVTATGAATIAADGTGGAVAPNSYGVAVTGTSSQIVSDTGNLGVIGRETGGTNEGVLVSLGGSIESTSGDISVQALSDVVVETDGTIQTSGTVDVEALRDVRLTAGANVGEDALISSTGSDTTVIADRDVILVSTANSTAEIHAQNDVAIVVDNAFPVAPGIGPGKFEKDTDSRVTSTAGLVRIFTAVRSQNTVVGDINGTPYVASPLYQDTATEMWGVYFFNASGGTPFTIFYKDDDTPIPAPSGGGAILPSVVDLIYELAVANAQLENLLAPFDPPRLRAFHGKFCVEGLGKELCRPNFSPYGSFIFEDNVYWIGESPPYTIHQK